MKKLVFGLIATVMFGFVGSAQVFNELQIYGKLHNEYVNLFLESGKKVSDYKDLNEFANEYYDIISKKYPQVEKEVFLKELDNTFLNDYMESGDIRSVFKNILEKMKNEKRISENVQKRMNQIIDTQNDYPKLLELTKDLENQELTEFERNSVGVFKSTLESSSVLWTTYSSKMNPGSMTIIGDCIGAFVFCYIPPVAALAGGSISLAIHNSDNP